MVFRPYKCDQCEIRYYRKYQLVKHLDTKHKTKKAAEGGSSDNTKLLDNDTTMVPGALDSKGQLLNQHARDSLLFQKS